jgi:hypothetical protein
MELLLSVTGEADAWSGATRRGIAGWRLTPMDGNRSELAGSATRRLPSYRLVQMTLPQAPEMAFKIPAHVIL